MEPKAARALGAVVFVLALVLAAGDARAAESRIVPVAVFLDSELPVAGARVSVVPTTDDPAHLGERRPLRQLTGGADERTNAAGVALLDFARLPERFTVVVRGGRSLGQRVPGALYAEAATRGDADVIEVNPVTTLTAFARTAGRDMRLGRARSTVKRLLAIPSWHDTTHDLHHSDRYFDGDAYLAAARRSDSVQSLNRRLLRELRDGDGERRRFRERAVRASASPLDWLKLAPEKLVETGLEQLATYAIGGLSSRSGSGGLGWLTSIQQAFGFTSQADQLAEIQGALEALGKQVTRLQGQIESTFRSVAENEVGLLAHQTDRTLGQIDHALSQLALLASLEPDDPTLPKFARTIDDYVGANLLDAPTILHRSLSPGLPLAGNVVKATSRAIAAATRVYDPGKQEQVAEVHNYFAVYQTQLAVLLANYWHSRPDTYSQETIRQNILQIQRNVAEQRNALKPPLPDGAWVDPATGLMWTFTIDPVSAPTFLQTFLPRSVQSNLDPIGGRPFTNWRLAVSDELTRLTSAISGSARVFLNSELGQQDAVRATTWTFDSLLPEVAGYRAYVDPHYIRLRVFNLNSNQFENLSDPGHQFDPRVPAHSWPTGELNTPAGQAWFAAKRVDGLLYVRQPAAGEDYWWGSARAGG